MRIEHKGRVFARFASKKGYIAVISSTNTIWTQFGKQLANVYFLPVPQHPEIGSLFPELMSYIAP